MSFNAPFVCIKYRQMPLTNVIALLKGSFYVCLFIYFDTIFLLDWIFIGSNEVTCKKCLKNTFGVIKYVDTFP